MNRDDIVLVQPALVSAVADANITLLMVSECVYMFHVGMHHLGMKSAA